MTGLDIKNDALIEVAALVTDSELNILGDGVDVVAAPLHEEQVGAEKIDLVVDPEQALRGGGHGRKR